MSEQKAIFLVVDDSDYFETPEAAFSNIDMAAEHCRDRPSMYVLEMPLDSPSTESVIHYFGKRLEIEMRAAKDAL